MSAPSLLVLLRSRVSLRSISLALKPTKKSIQSELSSCISNSRPQISSSSERRISLIARFDSLEWKKKKKLLFFCSVINGFSKWIFVVRVQITNGLELLSLDAASPQRHRRRPAQLGAVGGVPELGSGPSGHFNAFMTDICWLIGHKWVMEAPCFLLPELLREN
ncbi:protein NUCLEAR FUSION DEFECTIVE 6, chloroplastic/mitochondrial-like [Iris pallida]|uniref:Protein NUCLEAR FUSION DEFECTIVE 6, chloroplastic/mitochondrial-like n=1 Tax=Iris pallida TaxID=29817 RepID=A0AAX6DVU7_IRIPA|nr:protein NUCLEAR FUSION DEFECTIVE 6, chloroplastic/mitochondrial-like [Iris pallida]